MKVKYRRAFQKQRILLMMMAVIIPGLVVSGLSILYVSRQERARELALRESYRSMLDRVREETEGYIRSAVKKTFDEMAAAVETVTSGTPDRLQNLLKEILLKNPVVKYPFLIDAEGKYIFPFSRGADSTGALSLAVPGDTFFRRFIKKGSALYEAYKKAEDLEFRDRRFFDAIGYYLRSLETVKDRNVRLYIYHSIARCYYKLNKYPQAAGYLEDLVKEFPPLLKEDKAFYFRVLHQAAQTYDRVGLQSRAVEFYLRLYDEVLQYEFQSESAAPGERDAFGYFKNESLAYLIHHIGEGGDSGDRDSSERRRFDRARAREGIQDLSELDIDLQWKYFDVGPVVDSGHIDAGEKDALFFDKIREFYLPTDEKAVFYQEVKRLNLNAAAAKIIAGDGGIRTMNIRGLKRRLTVVFAPVNGSKGTAVPLFGFMISPEFARSRALPPAVKKFLGDDADNPLTVSIRDDDTPVSPGAAFYPLESLPFQRFPTGGDLVLAALGAHHIERVVKKEMWINYGATAAIITILILGTWFFYKYISREAELVRLKSDFVDSASHTLKTPLTRIRMMAEKLDLGWIKDEQKKKEYLRAIVSETDRMAEMIGNMLNFSKVESGKKHYDIKEGNLADYVRDIIEHLSGHARGLGFRFEIDIDTDLPSVLFDPEAIKLVLVNLIQNAIKYSREEKYISISLRKEGEHAVLHVTDHGMGIPAKEKDKIFEKFYRVSHETVHALEGSGLGLFLVRHAVTAHGGTVAVESKPGSGSTFTVTLPFSNILRKLS